jgi:hypothetical protein
MIQRLRNSIDPCICCLTRGERRQQVSLLVPRFAYVYCRLFVITPNQCLPRTVKQRYCPMYVHWLYYVRLIELRMNPECLYLADSAMYWL